MPTSARGPKWSSAPTNKMHPAAVNAGWGALLFSVLFRNAQQVIRRYLKEMAKSNDIFYTGLKFPTLNIGYLALRHIHRISKLGLI